MYKKRFHLNTDLTVALLTHCFIIFFKLFCCFLSPRETFFLLTSVFLPPGSFEYLCSCGQVVPWSAPLCGRWTRSTMGIGGGMRSRDEQRKWHCSQCSHCCKCGWNWPFRLAGCVGYSYFTQSYWKDAVALSVVTQKKFKYNCSILLTNINTRKTKFVFLSQGCRCKRSKIWYLRGQRWHITILLLPN